MLPQRDDTAVVVVLGPAALFEQGQRPTAVARRLGVVQAISSASLSTRGSSLVN